MRALFDLTPQLVAQALCITHTVCIIGEQFSTTTATKIDDINKGLNFFHCASQEPIRQQAIPDPLGDSNHNLITQHKKKCSK